MLFRSAAALRPARRALRWAFFGRCPRGRVTLSLGCCPRAVAAAAFPTAGPHGTPDACPRGAGLRLIRRWSRQAGGRRPIGGSARRDTHFRRAGAVVGVEGGAWGKGRGGRLACTSAGDVARAGGAVLRKSSRTRPENGLSVRRRRISFGGRAQAVTSSQKYAFYVLN